MDWDGKLKVVRLIGVELLLEDWISTVVGQESCFWKLFRIINFRLARNRSLWEVVCTFKSDLMLDSTSSLSLQCRFKWFERFLQIQRPKFMLQREKSSVIYFVSHFNWSISVALTIFDGILLQLFSFKREKKFSTTHCKQFLQSMKVETCLSS